MEFGLLDGLRVTSDGVDLTPSRPKQRILLAFLLVHAGEVVPSEDLVEALWGERPPNSAHTALHGHISMLRRKLGAERIETRPSGYALRMAEGDRLDTRRFEQLAGEARSEDPAARSAVLVDALAMFRGVPLAELRFEAFASREATRLEDLRITVLERRIDADLELGRHDSVISELEQLIVEHPLREGLRAQLMIALYRSGRQADALRVAQEARAFLADELGVDPGPALQQLEQQILNHDPRLNAPELPNRLRDSPPATKPLGIVTFLVAEVSGSSRRGESIDAAIESGRELVQVVTRRLGFEMAARRGFVRVAFARARDAAVSAAGIHRAAGNAGKAARIGMHSTDAIATDDGYAGPGVDTATHICRAAQPGQTLLSQATRDLLQEAPLDEVNLRDLGEHRLSDLERAQRLFQVVAAGEHRSLPRVRDLESRRTNLPTQPTALIGRSREIGEIAALLGEPDVKLVTLAGPGGIGKTRLAIHAAAELLDSFLDGVFIADLAPLQDAALVIPTIARILGVHEVPGEPGQETLGRHVRDLRLILVLDNLEHLRAAGPAIAGLLAIAPGLKVLATSRTALRVEGEQTYEVAPLPIPANAAALERVVSAESVALFTVRARAVRPEFAVTDENAGAVAGICRTLGGLPLAIELAAARSGVLPPAQLLARIGRHRELLKTAARDVPDRHRSLEGAIDWSYDLLGSGQRRLFERLGVFAGGCSLDAAERVCGDGLDVIDGLSELVGASLLRLEGTDDAPRFVMLEPIREYAARRLDASGDAEALRRRHAAHYTQLAEHAEPYLRGSPGTWPARLDRDHDNLRVALDRLEESGAHEEALRLAGALWRFWYLLGYLTEGRRRLERVLRAATGPTLARGKGLIGAAVLAVNSGDFERARLHAEEGLALHANLNDPGGAAYSRFMLGAAAEGSGELLRARDLYEASAQAFAELDDEHSALLVTRNLASTYLGLGDRSRAQALLEDNLRRARATNNERIEASTLGSLATIAFDGGRIEDAGWMLRESLRIHGQLGDRLDSAVDLCRAARQLSFTGQAGIAVRVLASFEVKREEVGHRRSWVAAMNAQTLAAARRQLDEATFAEAWRQGQALGIGQALALALGALG